MVEDTGGIDGEEGVSHLQSLAAVPTGEHGAMIVGQEMEEKFDPFNLRLMEILAPHVTLVLDRLEWE